MEEINLELSAFSAKLIEEVYDSVVISQSNQLKKHQEIKECLLMTAEEFSAEFVDEFEIEDEIRNLFNSDSPIEKININTERLNRIGKKLGIGISRDKFRGGRISPAIIAEIRKKIRLKIAKMKWNNLSGMVEKGLPKVTPVSGRISAKVMFRVAENNLPERVEKPNFPNTKPVPNEIRNQIKKSFAKEIYKRNSSEVKMFVNQAKIIKSTTEGDISGEIVLDFSITN
ncbi:MAG: hypothetical protein LUM44_10260 [Pyrinomonadaceae bacterium]|nr:hypothetical protein [Pyrinomonadaceae bacterium]